MLGIDIDTRKLTLCLLADDGPRWATATLETHGSRSGTALQAVRSLQNALVSAFAHARAGGIIEWPREAYVERGWGANRVADFQLGAIFGATVVALPHAVPGIHVDAMTTHEWKRAVTAAIGITTKRGQPGNANAPKEQANSACRILLIQAGEPAERVNALTPDELDAYGIAWTARERNRDEDELEDEHRRLRSTHGP